MEPLSAEEEREEEYPENQQRLPEAERHRLSNQSRAAQAEIQAILREHRYILAPRTIEIVEQFIRTLSDPEVLDTTRPAYITLLAAQDAYRDLGEFLPAASGADRGVKWRVRRLGRWLDLQWYKLKSWTRGLVWRLDMRIEDFGLLTGPQLTQDNVRNPPRAEIWKTVEQMEARGRSRVEIQRELHRQLAADPPPWLPVPLAGSFHTYRDSSERSPRLHDERFGPLKTGDAAHVCAHGVPLTKACRPCGFVVMPKDFAWGTDLPEEDKWPRRALLALKAATERRLSAPQQTQVRDRSNSS